MSSEFVASATIHINASLEQVWDALTNPEIIQQYFFGTKAVSDWKEGGKLDFYGEYQGKEYHDKGVIKKIVPNKTLQHTYLSSFSNLEDKPENYATVTYEITPETDNTKLVVTQDNIHNEEAQRHSIQNWAGVLKSMKDILEKN